MSTGAPATSLHSNYFLCRERVVIEYERTGELLADLASDQTSLHNPFGGGYYPVQLSYNEAQKMMSSEPMRFKELVQERCVCVCVCTYACVYVYKICRLKLNFNSWSEVHTCTCTLYLS